MYFLEVRMFGELICRLWWFHVTKSRCLGTGGILGMHLQLCRPPEHHRVMPIHRAAQGPGILLFAPKRMQQPGPQHWSAGPLGEPWRQRYGDLEGVQIFVNSGQSAGIGERSRKEKGLREILRKAVLGRIRWYHLWLKCFEFWIHTRILSSSIMFVLSMLVWYATFWLDLFCFVVSCLNW